MRTLISGQTVNWICGSCDQMGNFQLWESICVNVDLFVMLVNG